MRRYVRTLYNEISNTEIEIIDFVKDEDEDYDYFIEQVKYQMPGREINVVEGGVRFVFFHKQSYEPKKRKK